MEESEPNLSVGVTPLSSFGTDGLHCKNKQSHLCSSLTKSRVYYLTLVHLFPAHYVYVGVGITSFYLIQIRCLPTEN